jgi:hypothetical protein
VLEFNHHAGQFGDRFGLHQVEDAAAAVFDGSQTHVESLGHRAVLAAFQN